MTLKMRLNEKVAELEQQAVLIRQIAKEEPSLKAQQEWLSLLTSYVFTLTEIHELDRENLAQVKALV